MLNEQSNTLDYLTQPVLFVRAFQIIDCNRAARERMQSEERSIESFLSPDEMLCYREFDGVGAMELTLLFAGRAYSATVRREQAYDVFVAAANPLYEELSLDTLAVVAQSLRMPLTDLFDVASVLFPMLEEQEDPKIQKQTARLNKSFYQLLRLAGNLTDAGSLITGQSRLHLERTDMGEFFGRIYDSAEPLAAAIGIEMEYHCPQKHFYCSIDRQKMERAVLNLISNAMKFTPGGGKIIFRVEQTAASVLVRIIDNGEGMEPAQMATLFDRYQHRAQPGDPRWGVGLGLPLVRYIANLHGGTVIVTSLPGKGTSATMSISIRQTQTQAQLNTPMFHYDYVGGYNHASVELSDTLPSDVFDSMNIN